LLLRRYKSEQIVRFALTAQLLVSTVFVIGAIGGWFGLAGTLAMIFLVLCCVGLTNPNTSALCMAPFAKNAGVASSLMGSMQLGLGATASFCVGIFSSRSTFPLAAIMAGSSAVALLVLLIGRRNIRQAAHADPASVIYTPH
jgi:MFS transporter, DHA1 family, multidrug resistance protein